ncbi:MAG: T9SS type A sorting domain-containing protein [Salinibacter sp.]
MEITVYNLLGQRVAALLNRPQPAGRTEIAVDGSRWATGTYFVRMVADQQIRTQRMAILR